MSYDTINNGIVGRLQGLGYQQSQYQNLDACPSQELENTFLLNFVSGEADEEALYPLVYDNQKWQIIIGFERSSENQSIVMDKIGRAKDALIKDLDNPANWESYARVQRYKSWKVEDKKSYFILTIELKIVDTILY
jgi:hypothetical protein